MWIWDYLSPTFETFAVCTDIWHWQCSRKWKLCEIISSWMAIDVAGGHIHSGSIIDVCPAQILVCSAHAFLWARRVWKVCGLRWVRSVVLGVLWAMGVMGPPGLGSLGSRVLENPNEMKPKCVNWNWEIPSNSQPFIAFEMSYNVRYFFFLFKQKNSNERFERI